MSGPWKLRGYVVERLLGSGGSGEVWRAHVSATDEPVALKRLSVRDAEQARRAHAEAAILTVLDHPHLVRLHAVVPDDEVAVLVLDLADGGSLADLLAARGGLTPGEVITAVAPIAAALAYLHGEGVVHGDVSPANVLFTTGGVPLLADLGVARLTGDDADAESTPAYIDPAVAAGCVPGPQSDVFMLAAAALHALTGAPPWAGETAHAVLATARAGALDDVGARLAAAGVPPQMAAVLRRALAVDPQRRGTAADLALDLRHSGQPVAVELSAGRARPEPVSSNAVRVSGAGPGRVGRHAALPITTGSVRRSDAGLEWHSVAAGVLGAPPPTGSVGPRPRPVIPRPTRRRPARRAVVLIAAVAVLAVVVAGLLWWRAGRATPSAGPPAHGRSATASGAPPVGTDWARSLAALDAVRAKAFATRDARLLRRVYLPGPLLTADEAMLARLVPAGCRLLGVRTRYDHVRASVHGASVLVTARATLPASSLVCRGRPTRRAAGAGPATLQLELTRTATGLRIAEQQVT